MFTGPSVTVEVHGRVNRLRPIAPIAVVKRPNCFLSGIYTPVAVRGACLSKS